MIDDSPVAYPALDLAGVTGSDSGVGGGSGSGSDSVAD